MNENRAVIPPNQLEVSRIARNSASLGNLVDVMCRAFERDPHINWLIRQDAGRTLAIAELFQLLLTDMGGELHATADHKSAALWFPPEQHSGWYAQTRFFLRLLSLAGPLRALQRGIDLKRMDRRHPARPHYYLQLLGVAPECQGQGYGNALLAYLINRAEMANCPIYLETSNQQNADFYARHGFSNQGETSLSGGLRLWSMIWRPNRLA